MTSSDRRRRIAGTIAVALSVIATDARADEPPGAPAPEADPKPAFDAGRELVRAGRYAEAAQKFEESIAVRATPGAYLNIGDCMEKLGRYKSARDAFERAGELAREASRSDHAAEAADRSDRLRGLVSEITVRVAPDVADALVSLDGSPAPRNIAIGVDGGPHTVRVTVPCRVFETVVQVGLRADAKAIDVSRASLGDDPSCARPRPVVAPPPSNVRLGLAVATASVGLAATVTGAAFGLAAAGSKDELVRACATYPNGCPAERSGELLGIAGDADRSAAWSTAFFVTGAALLAASVVLYVTRPRARSTAGGGTSLHVSF